MRSRLLISTLAFAFVLVGAPVATAAPRLSLRDARIEAFEVGPLAFGEGGRIDVRRCKRLARSKVRCRVLHYPAPNIAPGVFGIYRVDVRSLDPIWILTEYYRRPGPAVKRQSP